MNCFRYLSYVTVRRTANLLKLYISFWISRLLRRPVLWGRPLAVSVEPGTACNLHCPECPTGAGILGRPKGLMPLSLFSSIIEDMSPELTVLNLYLQGEPLLHPGFTEMVKVASQKNIYTITSTNGQVFDRKIAEDLVDNGLSEIYFSLDGVTQTTYEKYRKGGDIEKVKKAIKTLAEVKREKEKSDPLIVVQFIVFKHNEHEIEEFRSLAKVLGADRAEIKTAQFNEFSNGEVEPPEDPRYRRYADAAALKLKGRTYNHCWKSWMSMVFTWNGAALPCCYDKDGIYAMGSYSKGKFNAIWYGEKNRHFKTMILQRKRDIDICKNCTEGRNIFF